MNSFRRAVSDLSRAQKTKRGVSLYSRFVNRPLGRLFAAFFYSVGMSPNQVTAVSAATTAAGLVLLVSGPPSLWRALVVAALLVLGFAFDSADGQVSRLSGTSSRAGEWLDHVVDAGKMVAVHAAVLVMLYLYVPAPAWVLAIPLVFQFVAVVTFAAGVIVELLKRVDGGRAPSRAPSTLRAVALIPADYGILAVSFVLTGWPVIFLVVYGVLLVAGFAIMVLLLVKWFRELAAV
ncbi:MAG TPA: CDP-alcohol phosphatidyltransferase family protein [Humibacter sp.]|nr:CDP-alcohol phosphatidyltransferase family protein [Humibacter sp.]